MSLQFLRNLNKNVKESLSALNEGLEITNGVAEVGKLHLPYLLQLLPRLETAGEAPTCCIFRSYRIPSAVANDGEPSSEQGESPKSSLSKPSFLKLLTDRKEQQKEETVSLSSNHNEEHGPTPPVLAPSNEPCPLGDGCLLRKIDAVTYVEAMSSVKEFMESVDKTMETQSVATRHLLETQALPVLCCLIRLAEVADFIRKPNGQLGEIIKNPEALYTEMLEAVVSSLKQINRILVYPEDLVKLQNRPIYCEKFSPSVRDVNGAHACLAKAAAGNIEFKETNKNKALLSQLRYNSYDYNGNIAIVSLSTQERDRCQHQLSLLKSVGIETEYGRSLLSAVGICLGGYEILERDIVSTALEIIEKMYCHNDMAWIQHQHDDQNIYTVDKLDTFYTNWQMCTNGNCFGCNKPVGIKEIPGSMTAMADGTFCECVISRNDLVSPYRERIKTEILASHVGPYDLLRTALQTSDMLLKTKVTALLLQMTLNSSQIAKNIVETECISLILDMLETCHIEQFSVLNELLDSLTEENLQKGAAAVDEELAIGTSFVPCYLDSILILRHCLKTVGVNKAELPRVVNAFTELLFTMTSIWVYMNYPGRKEQETRVMESFTRVMCIVIDACIALLTSDVHEASVKSTVEGPPAPKNLAQMAVMKLVNRQKATDELILKEVLETGIIEHVLLTSHAICSLSKYGNAVNVPLLNQLMRLAAVCFLVSKSSNGAIIMFMERVLSPIGTKLLPIYRCLYGSMQQKGIELLKTLEVSSEHQAVFNQLLMETIGDVANVPVLVHWLLLMLDSEVEIPGSESLRHLILEMIVTSNLCQQSDTVRSIMDYIHIAHKASSMSLNESIIPVSKLTCHVIRPMELATLLSIHGNHEGLQMMGPFQDPWKIGIEIINAYIGRTEESSMIMILAKLLQTLLAYLCHHGDDLVKHYVDMNPLMEIMGIRGSEPHMAMIKQLASLLVALGYAFQEREEVWKLECMISISKNLMDLYSSEEHVNALGLFADVEAVVSLDPMVESYEYMLRNFRSQHSYPAVANSTAALIWDLQNLCVFSMTPQVHMIIRNFRQTLHSHVMAKIIADMRRYSLVHEEEMKLKSSKTDEEIEQMRRLHTEETAFAQNRITAITSQLNVITESYYMAEQQIRATREELELALAENIALRDQLQELRESK